MSKYRHEYKYNLNAKQEAILQCRATGILSPDLHAGEDGMYTIRSVYFDDINNTCLYENINGTDPRSKFRIRYYNHNLDYIVLEKKIKERGMCKKESCRLSVEESNCLLHGDSLVHSENYSKLKMSLLEELRIRRLLPQIIVTYERRPFIYDVGNVRITFDKNVTSSNDIDLFMSGDYSTRPIFSPGQSLLEVKWDEILPRHIKDVMQLDELRWTAFSKYSMCRKYHL